MSSTTPTAAPSPDGEQLDELRELHDRYGTQNFVLRCLIDELQALVTDFARTKSSAVGPCHGPLDKLHAHARRLLVCSDDEVGDIIFNGTADIRWTVVKKGIPSREQVIEVFAHRLAERRLGESMSRDDVAALVDWALS